jgi:nicotinamidase-related amidase
VPDLACLAIHYQNDVIHETGRIKLGVGDETKRRSVIAAAGRLLEGVRRAGIPVVSVRIAFRPDFRDVIQNCPIFRNVVAGQAMPEGSWGTEFYEGLGPVPGEFVVTHSRINGFFGSPLEHNLAALGARRLIVAGVATNSSVEHTVRHAVDLGYEVMVASDACSVADARLHQASLDNMALLAEILTVDEILSRLPRA